MNAQLRRENIEGAVYAVYQLCVRKQYFTCGCNSAYEKMFDLIRMKRPVGEIAAVIWANSSKDSDLGTIIEEVSSCIYIKN